MKARLDPVLVKHLGSKGIRVEQMDTVSAPRPQYVCCCDHAVVQVGAKPNRTDYEKRASARGNRIDAYPLELMCFSSPASLYYSVHPRYIRP